MPSIVSKLNKITGKDATTIEGALENLESSGSGGGDSNTVIVNITTDYDWSQGFPPTKIYVSDKTFEEVSEQIQQGKSVFAHFNDENQSWHTIPLHRFRTGVFGYSIQGITSSGSNEIQLGILEVELSENVCKVRSLTLTCSGTLVIG